MNDMPFEAFGNAVNNLFLEKIVKMLFHADVKRQVEEIRKNYRCRFDMIDSDSNLGAKLLSDSNFGEIYEFCLSGRLSDCQIANLFICGDQNADCSNHRCYETVIELVEELRNTALDPRVNAVMSMISSEADRVIDSISMQTPIANSPYPQKSLKSAGHLAIETTDLVHCLQAHTASQFQSRSSYGFDEINSSLYPAIINEETAEILSPDANQPHPLVSCINKAQKRGLRRRHMMLVGDGGMGKTISLLESATCLLKSSIVTVYIPLFDSRLYDDASGKCIEHYIRTHILGDEATLWEAFEGQRNNRDGGYKRIVLFLDGWNEIPDHASLACSLLPESTIADELNRHWIPSPNVQVVISGREDALHGVCWNLELTRYRMLPLQKEQIAKFLKKSGVSAPGEKSAMWATISNTMMLLLYVSVNTLIKQFEHNPTLPFIVGEDSERQGALIWNYLLCQIGKFSSMRPASVTSYFSSILFAASYIGWHMTSNGRYLIGHTELVDAINHAGILFEKYWRDSEICGAICLEYRIRSWRWEVLDILDILIRETRIIRKIQRPDSTRLYAFGHQKFRDCYAAIFMKIRLAPFSTQISNLEKISAWAQPVSIEVLDLLSPQISPGKLEQLWNAQSTISAASNSKTHSNLLSLFERRGMLATLDFYGQDLSNTPLQRWYDDISGMNFSRAIIDDSTLMPFGPESWPAAVEWVPAEAREDSRRFMTAIERIDLWDIETGDAQPLAYSKAYQVLSIACSNPGNSIAFVSNASSILSILPSIEESCLIECDFDFELLAVCNGGHDSFFTAGSAPYIHKATVRGNPQQEFDCDCDIVCDLSDTEFEDVTFYQLRYSSDDDLLAALIAVPDRITLKSRFFVLAKTVRSDTLPQRIYPTHDDGSHRPILEFALNSTSLEAVYVTAGGEVISMNLTSGSNRCLQRIDAGFQAVGLSPTSRKLAFVGADGILICTNTYTGEFLFASRIDHHAALVSRRCPIAFSPLETRVLVTSPQRGGFAVFNISPSAPDWKLEDNQVVPSSEIERNAIRAESRLAFQHEAVNSVIHAMCSDNCNQNVYIGCGWGEIRRIDLNKRSCAQSCRVSKDAVRLIELSLDGKLMGAACGRSRLSLLSADGMSPLASFDYGQYAISHLALSPSGAIVACALDSQTISFLDVNRLIRPFEAVLSARKPITCTPVSNGRITSIAFASETDLFVGFSTGELVHITTVDNQIDIIDHIESNRVVALLITRAMPGAIYSFRHDGTTHLWTLDGTGIRKRKLFGHRYGVPKSISIEPDGKYVTYYVEKEWYRDGSEALFIFKICRDGQFKPVGRFEVPHSSIKEAVMAVSRPPKVCWIHFLRSIMIQTQDDLFNISFAPGLNMIGACFREAQFTNPDLKSIVRYSGGITT